MTGGQRSSLALYWIYMLTSFLFQGLVLGFVLVSIVESDHAQYLRKSVNPYHWALIAGILMQTAAQTAAHIISKSLTDKYLVHANAIYFEPHDLKLHLMKTAAMHKFIGIDEGMEPGKAMAFAKAAGRITENIVLRLPLPRLGRLIEVIHRDLVRLIIPPTCRHHEIIYDMLDLQAPAVDRNSSNGVTGRRLAQLRGYIYPVNIHVPPPATPSSLYDKSSALAMKMDAWRRGLFVTNATRNRQLLAIAEGRAPPGSLQPYTTGGGKIMDTLGSAWNARQEAKARWSRRGARKLGSKVKKLDRMEMNQTDGLVWLVVLDLEQGTVFYIIFHPLR